MNVRRCAFLAIALAILSLISTAGAQDAGEPVRITLHAAKPPRTSWDYRLLPEYAERMPGNAAVYYGKVKFEENRFFGQQGRLEAAINLLTTPLDKVLAAPVDVSPPMYYMEQAALCDDCDWQLPLRRQAFEDILLPEVQECRQFGRYLGASGRQAIAHHDYLEAVRRFRCCNAMARHVAKGETIVNAMVGVAICEIASQQLLDLVQQADAPNLYWSLAKLPVPMIDIRDALGAERGAALLALPELRDPAKESRSDAEWQATLLAYWTQICEWTDIPPWKQPPEKLVRGSLDSHEVARSELVSRGWDADWVNGLPAAHAVLVYVTMVDGEIGDLALASYFRPYPDAMSGIARAQAKLAALREQVNWSLPLGPMCLDAMASSRTSIARCDRRLAVLQVLEALRLFAANNNGKLPQRLSDLDVAVPADPGTGRPFRYLLEGEAARLGGPPLGDATFDYEITMLPAAP